MAQTSLVPADRPYFVLLQRLGRGGSAETWRARRQGGLLADEVCIKRPILPVDEQRQQALIEESRVLSRIRHQNVVSLLGAHHTEEGEVFLVLELVDGIDLRRLIRALGTRRLPPEVIAGLGLGLCRALAAAQRALPPGVVHRDLSPSNVLISREGEVKLADFGVARAFDRERWTGPGLVKGKMAYVSPEQARGGDLDIRSDLFALGVVLFELLAGRRPFIGSDRLSTLRAIVAGERPALAALVEKAPPALLSAVERLLASHRDDRPRSADAAARLLALCADEHRTAGELRRLVLQGRLPGLVRAPRPVVALRSAPPAER